MNKKVRLNKWIIIPQGLTCKPSHPVDYGYARGMIIMHKPWNKTDTHEVLLNNRIDTIRAFDRMVSNNELPTSVVAQYILVMNYTDKRWNEIVAQGGITQDVVNLDNMDNDERDHFEAYQHHNHMTDNR